MKKCTYCKTFKDLSSFGKNKARNDGLQTYCLKCKQDYNFKKRQKTLENKKISNLKEEHKICRCCLQELHFSNFWKTSKNGIHSRCKKCEVIRIREYNQRTGWSREYVKKRNKEDKKFYIKKILRLRLLDALKRHTSGGKVNKKHSALVLLDCDIEHLVIHLENKFKEGMTWENRGTYWEIDHIIPCDAFNLTDAEEQKKCFHYTNLQPLTVSENRSKGNKFTKK